MQSPGPALAFVYGNCVFLCSVVGEKEQANGTVNVRTRDNKVHGEHSVADVIAKFKRFRDTKALDAEDKFQ